MLEESNVAMRVGEGVVHGPSETMRGDIQSCGCAAAPSAQSTDPETPHQAVRMSEVTQERMPAMPGRDVS